MESILNNPWFVPVVMSLVILGLFPLVVGYIVLVERKVLADMQVRLGPMRVGPHGILQPLADAVKLLAKEDVIPADADQMLFWAAPVISTFTALTALAVVPFANGMVIADVNVGLLIITAVSSLGILGIILGGWASNSHYSLLGSLRSAAQLVSYEVALALALLSGVMAAGSLSMVDIVKAQAQHGIWLVFDNYGFMIVPFVAYFISSVAEVNRAPFDLPEAESELVAGFMTEYSGFRWALYFLAEYTNILVFASVAVTLFLGGWLRPFPSAAWLDIPLNFIFPVALFLVSGLGCFYLGRRFRIAWRRVFLDVLGVCLLLVAIPFAVPAANAALIGLFWFFLKVGTIVYVLIWVRATFPRLRYDQLMNLGWKVMIPIGMASLLINAIIGIARQ